MRYDPRASTFFVFSKIGSADDHPYSQEGRWGGLWVVIYVRRWWFLVTSRITRVGRDGTVVLAPPAPRSTMDVDSRRAMDVDRWCRHPRMAVPNMAVDKKLGVLVKWNGKGRASCSKVRRRRRLHIRQVCFQLQWPDVSSLSDRQISAHCS